MKHYLSVAAFAAAALLFGCNNSQPVEQVATPVETQPAEPAAVIQQSASAVEAEPEMAAADSIAEEPAAAGSDQPVDEASLDSIEPAEAEYDMEYDQAPQE